MSCVHSSISPVPLSIPASSPLGFTERQKQTLQERRGNRRPRRCWASRDSSEPLEETHMQGVAGTPTPSTNLGPQWKEGRAEVSRYSRESHGHRALRIPWWRSSQGWWESEAEAVLTGSCPQTVSGRAWLDPWTGEGKVSPHSWEVLCRGWEGV